MKVIILFLFSTVFVTSVSAQSYEYTEENQPRYQCGSIQGDTHFPDGVCLPWPTETNIPDEIRIRLYAACDAGIRTYGAQLTCCEHLTPLLAKKLQVDCGGFGGKTTGDDDWGECSPSFDDLQ